MANQKLDLDQVSDLQRLYKEILQRIAKTEELSLRHETRLQEHEESIDFAVRKVKQFEYYKDRKEELEVVAAFYLQDWIEKSITCNFQLQSS